MKTKDQITIKTEDEIKILREAGRILSSIIKELQGSLTSGITTKEIDKFAEDLIFQHKVKPAFKGYRGFPACTCLSVNQEVVHGVPGKRILKNGDIVSVDVGIIFKDYFSDTAVTVGIGKIDSQLQELLDVTKESLYKGIDQAKVSNHLSDISHAIQEYVESKNFSVVRNFVGHGIGRSLHEEPEIPNFGLPHQGPILKEGMVFAIEPMVNMGSWHTKVLEDGWTVVTEDGKPSAHFEHTVVVSKKGPEILTD